MLRVVGLTLVLVVGMAAPAEANDGYVGEAAAGAAHRGATTPGVMPLVQHAAPPLQLTRAWGAAPWFSWRTRSAGLRRDLTLRVGITALSPERRDAGGALIMPWLSQGKSGLRLPVTERLSFAVGYRRLQGEDLWRRYAETGSVDYDSHDFLLRAHWRF